MGTFTQIPKLTRHVHRFDPSTALTIRVGGVANSQTFLVNESLLTARSEYFRRAMNGKWLEYNTREIDLVDDDPDIFALYLNLVYKNELPTATLRDADVETLGCKELVWETNKELMVLFEIYAIAEKFQDTSAKDGVVAAVFQLTQNVSWFGRPLVCGPRIIELVYSSTPVDSPARRLLVDMCCNSQMGPLLRKSPHLPKDFLSDLFMVMQRELGGKNIMLRNGVAAYLEANEEPSKEVTHGK